MAAAKRLLSMSVDEEGLTWQALLDRYKIRPKHAGNAGAKDTGAKGSLKERTGEEKEGGVEDREMAGKEKAGGVEDDEYEYDDDFQGAKGDAKHEDAIATEEHDEDRWDEEGDESRVRVMLTRNALSAGCRVRVCLSDPPAPHPPRPITTGTIAEVLSLALIAIAAQTSLEAAHGRGLTWYLAIHAVLTPTRSTTLTRSWRIPTLQSVCLWRWATTASANKSHFQPWAHVSVEMGRLPRLLPTVATAGFAHTTMGRSPWVGEGRTA